MDSLELTLLGTAAGLCTTFSFVPQVVKARREGDTRAISLRMYWVSVTAFALWIVHGVMVGSLPIVVFNALNVILGGIVLWLVLRGRRLSQSGTPEGQLQGCGLPQSGTADGHIQGLPRMGAADGQLHGLARTGAADGR